MSFQAWLKQERWLNSSRGLIGRWFFRRRRVSGREEIWLTALWLVPFCLVWWQPFLLTYAALVLAVTAAITAWRTWERGVALLAWLASLFMLALYWGSSFLLWLFLETTSVRLLLLSICAIVGWWYLVDWHRYRRLGDEAERGSGQLSTVAAGFMSALALGSAAQGLIVFLDTALWTLLWGCYLPLVLSFISLVYINGWSVRRAWAYYLTAAAVLLQVFILVTWWPTTIFTVGFVLAVTYAMLGLSLRQEAQGFINRRSFGKELLLLAVALVIVLLTASWY